MPEMVLNEALKGNIRYFVAKKDNIIISYLKTGDDGEHFSAKSQDMMNISGVYLPLDYRGSGIFDNLLFYVENVFDTEGFKRLGVDFESFNPTACGFGLNTSPHILIRLCGESMSAPH